MAGAPVEFLESAVRAATPIGLAAAGELIAERAGVINIGLEGSMCLAAFVAFATALHAGPEAGLVAGAAAGAALALLLAILVTRFRAHQIIAGTAITMLGVAGSAALNRILADRASGVAHIETLPPIAVPLLDAIPIVGPALFHQPGPTYLLILALGATAWMLHRTTLGLAIRGTGEAPAAVVAAGRSPASLQMWAVVASGLLAGAGGATLVVAQAGTFTDNMSAGRGFIAIAVVALGRWTPLGVAGGALLFGAASSAQYLAQAYGAPIPYNLSLAAPYAITLVALAFLRGSRSAPAALGRPL